VTVRKFKLRKCMETPPCVTDNDDIQKVEMLITLTTGISIEDIRGKKRTWEIIYARHLKWWLISKWKGWSSVNIGNRDRVDHATVLNALRQFENYRQYPRVKAQSDHILAKLCE
jgi:chromosomal replication initiation ATPase DnaA